MLARRCVRLLCGLGLLLAAWATLAGAASALSDDGWGAFEQLDDSPSHPPFPRTCSDGQGRITAVWGHTAAAYPKELHAARYLRASGWLAPERIDDGSMNYGIDQWNLACDHGGNTTAVWIEHEGSSHRVHARRYDFGLGWGPESILDIAAVQAFSPDVAADAVGRAMVVWQQTGPGGHDLWSNRYLPGLGWQGAVLIEHSNNGSVDDGQVALDAAGNAVVVWSQLNGSGRDPASHFDIWANRYLVGSGWQEPTLLETDDNGDGAFPQVAVDASGNAVAVWIYWIGNSSYIVANGLDAEGGWANSTVLDGGANVTVGIPNLLLGPGGSALAAWSHFANGSSEILTARFEEGTGWLAPLPVGNGGSYPYTLAALASDPGGNATAMWIARNGSNRHLMAARFSVSQGWQSAESIEQGNETDASGFAPASTPSGDVLAVGGLLIGSTWRILAIHYESDDTRAPVLALSSPDDGAGFSVPVTTVAGSTEPGVTVRVNGALAEVLPDGSFALTVPLGPGLNTLWVEAVDGAGNVARATRLVTYIDPVPGLLAEIELMQVQLNATLESIDSLENASAASAAEAHALVAQAAESGGQILTLLEDLNSSRAELEEAQWQLAEALDKFNSSQGQVAELQNALSATSQQLAAANESLAEALRSLSGLDRRLAEAEAQVSAADEQAEAQRKAADESRARLQRAEDALAWLALAVGALAIFGAFGWRSAVVARHQAAKGVEQARAAEQNTGSASGEWQSRARL